MRRFIILLIALATVLAAVLAQGSHEEEGKVRIGISKLIAHPALDAIEQGIKDYLAENGIDADIETQVANGEISTAASIAQLFRTEGMSVWSSTSLMGLPRASGMEISIFLLYSSLI